MSYIDLIILVVMALLVFAGYHKGFVRMLFSLAKVVVTIPLSFLISDWLLPSVMNDVVTPYALEQIESKLQSLSGGADSVAEQLQEAFPSLPASAVEALQQQWDQALTSDPQFAQHLFDNTIEPAVSIITQVVLFLAVFLILSIVLWVVSLLLKPKKDSALGKADRFFGGVLGLVKAVILLFVFCTIVQLLSSFMDSFESNSLVQALQQSLIVRYVNIINPFNTFI